MVIYFLYITDMDYLINKFKKTHKGITDIKIIDYSNDKCIIQYDLIKKLERDIRKTNGFHIYIPYHVHAIRIISNKIDISHNYSKHTRHMCMLHMDDYIAALNIDESMSVDQILLACATNAAKSTDVFIPKNMSRYISQVCQEKNIPVIEMTHNSYISDVPVQSYIIYTIIEEFLL